MSDGIILLSYQFLSTQLLTEGARVRLWSNAYGMNVRIQENGTVDGKGWSAFYGVCLCVSVCIKCLQSGLICI